MCLHEFRKGIRIEVNKPLYNTASKSGYRSLQDFTAVLSSSYLHDWVVTAFCKRTENGDTQIIRNIDKLAQNNIVSPRRKRKIIW
jgi:hypothetical protein